jgi:hypothetical protein
MKSPNSPSKKLFSLPWRIGIWEIQAVDALILATFLFFNLLAILFNSRVHAWLSYIITNFAFVLLFLLILYLQRITRHRLLRFLLRTASVQLLFAKLFDVVHALQHILHPGWNDSLVINLEQKLFGIQPTVWLQRFISPGLTEWMMFAYVIYIPIYPILCAIIYFKHGEGQMEDYLFTLGVTNVLCDIGFILFPVAGPMHTIASQYTVPLRGYFFTACGEYIRHNLHQIGGTIPSPHCAVATIMWIMAYRYSRPFFYALSPIIISLYVSTFYGRFHYISDSVVGILTAVLATLL